MSEAPPRIIGRTHGSGFWTGATTCETVSVPDVAVTVALVSEMLFGAVTLGVPGVAVTVAQPGPIAAIFVTVGVPPTLVMVAPVGATGLPRTTGKVHGSTAEGEATDDPLISFAGPRWTRRAR